MTISRCAWCLSSPLYIDYHDKEWGIPLYEPQNLFEILILEGMQAGLSWLTILQKREAMRASFFNFSPEKLASLTEADLAILLCNKTIIRNRLKLQSVRTNARSFLHIAEKKSIPEYFWQFTENKVVQNRWNSLDEIPSKTTTSTAMAKQLKKDGFSFMGPISCYAFMQSVGMVNDHITTCFRWPQLR